MLGFAVRAIQLRKRNVPLNPGWPTGPWIHLFYTERFSESGLRARRICLLSALGLIIFVALVIVITR
jgi:hypothetical protein